MVNSTLKFLISLKKKEFPHSGRLNIEVLPGDHSKKKNPVTKRNRAVTGPISKNET